MPIIGIDLGTTNSLVSIFSEDGPIIIPNVLGQNLTPSIVSIDDDGQIYVGEIAKERQITNPDKTVAIFKRNMGTKKEFKIGKKKFLPEELSAIVLKSLKKDAEAYLGEEITEAIISVPAYFNDVQRKATQRAGELAGLKVERLISEPTAAAVAYGLHEKSENTKFIIFDLGGGTFDVSILELHKNIMEVRAVAGDNYLGGEDFTDVIVALFAKHHNINIETLDEKTFVLMRKQAEKAKLDFYSSKGVDISCKINDEVLKYHLRADDYEKACHHLFVRLKTPIERALKDAAIKVKEIDSIVLVGGSTKLWSVRSFVTKVFNRLPSSSIDPDEAVALGTGIHAAMKERNTLIKEMILTDVCPYTLGTNVSIEKPGGFYQSGYFCPIIDRNTIIPVSKTERLYTISENQRKICVEILQGESRKAKDNINLGEITVPVPPGRKGEQAIDIRYTYDINGILEVEVTVVETGLTKKVIIEKNPGYMTKEEIATRMEELKSIKIHPREKYENKLLISKSERLYEESTGNNRSIIAMLINKFEDALEKQSEEEIRHTATELRELITEIEEGEF